MKIFELMILPLLQNWKFGLSFHHSTTFSGSSYTSNAGSLLAFLFFQDIEWLVGEAKQRYKNLCGVTTKLTLKTHDGALLNPADKINVVIMNDEELIGEVVGLDLPPLVERYKSLAAEKSVSKL